MALARCEDMSLEKYTRQRLVVQLPNTTVYDAARAMEENHIGCVVVHDGRGPVGIVTDRDLALQLIGYDLDPIEATLKDVMSTPLATIQVTASEDEAGALMLERHVRRLPVLNGNDLVGLVTLDDLIADQAVDPVLLGRIVRAQLAEPARLKPRGETHPTAPVHGDRSSVHQRFRRRREARMKLAYGALIHRVLVSTGLPTPEQAEAALETVLSALVRRITAEEASHLLAELPRLARVRLAGLAHGPDRTVTRKSIETAVAHELSIAPHRAADIVQRVGLALEQSISAGEIEDIRAQLPPDLRAILPTATAA